MIIEPGRIINDFIEPNKRQYAIPVYQRNYEWSKEQCEKLYTKAIDLASLTGNEVVLDAYCGIGTIGMIASKKAKEVYGVEIIADAIKDAKMNAKNNNINNCKFY